jgi:peptidoglycan/LPS O-acetylase OafA/YrhL
MAQRIPQLDGVRGIAILAVMVHNLGAFSIRPFSYLTTYGWMGVDLFFVLSGFLITGILLDTKRSERYFKNFYVRRCLRIWPLYYAILLCVFVVVPLVRHQEAFPIFQRSSPWWSYVFFLQNFLVATPTGAFGPLGVTWSLAVEELFYLVWPLFVRLLSTSQLWRLAWGVLVFSPVLRLYLSRHDILIYSNPFCRLDGLMAGALLAILVRKAAVLQGAFTKYVWAILVGAASLAIVSEQLSTRWFTFSMTVVASAALVYLALYSTRAWLRYLLTSRFLTYTGIISYGLYLLHKLPYDFMKAMHVNLNPTVAFLAIAACSYLLALLSWNLLEKPFLKLKVLFDAPRTA